MENTIRSQYTVAKTLRSIHPNLFEACGVGLSTFRECVASWLDDQSDEEVVKKLHDYDFHPDNLDILARLKSGIELKVSRQRKRTLVKLYDELVDVVTRFVVLGSCVLY